MKVMASSFSPVVLVTGASSGIGFALAKFLQKTDYRAVLTARPSSVSRLQKFFLPNEHTLILPLDITEASQRESVICEIEKKWGGVDILVNNAGISYRAVVEHMSNEEELHQLNTNYLSAMALTRLVLPYMRSKRSGKIINVSSVGGMMAMPTMSAYSASKFALEGATESLWYEMHPWNVSVTLIQPGFIHSSSFEHVFHSKRELSDLNHESPYHHYYEYMEPFISKMMNMSLSTSEDVAKKILKTMNKKNPPLRVPATLDAYIFSWLRRLLPRWIYHKVLYWFLPKIRKWVD
jgi:short-subunit dehydrogenase